MKPNKLISSISALKGVSVSKIPCSSKEIGSYTNQPSKQELHYLDFEKYRKEYRHSYSPKYVETNFYKIQELIGLPDNSTLVFLSVKLKGKNADWITSNNACNAFEMKFKRYFWKRKWKFMNTFVGSIEFDNEHLTYHFHSLLVMKELKTDFSSKEIEIITTDILKGLKETNEKNAELVVMRMFPFSLETTDLGDTVEYMVKTSSKNFNPLQRKIFNKLQQQQLRQL